MKSLQPDNCLINAKNGIIQVQNDNVVLKVCKKCFHQNDQTLKIVKISGQFIYIPY